MNRWSVAAALVLTFSAASVSAQVVGNGAATQFVGTKVAGIYAADTTGRPLQADVNGRLLVSDDSQFDATLTGAGLNGVSIASGQAKQALTAVAVSSYGKFDLLVSWNTAAAADSDSVAIAINVYGKVSAEPLDGLNYRLAPARTGGVADTGRVVLPAGVKAVPWFAPPTVLILSAAKLSGGANINLKVNGTGHVVTVPWHCIRFTQGSNAVMLNLADILGDFSPQYALIEVANWGNTNLTNVTTTWSPRVN